MVNLKTSLIAALLCLTGSVVHAATLESRLDRTEVTRGETLNLTVSLDQQVLVGEPDFSKLEKDFEIISRNRQSRYSNANGKRFSVTQWMLTLLPRREGTLLIPSFNFKGQVSGALEVIVQKQTATVDTDAPLFTELLISEKTIYVQQQTLLTLRLYTTMSLNNFAMSSLTIPNAEVVKLAENQYQKTVNGKDYTVVETGLAIFAEQSGQLTVPSVHYSGVIEQGSNRNFWRRAPGKRITVSTEEKILTIKARPANASTKTWLPAHELILHSRWNGDEPVFRVGEPVTRTIVQTANGLAGNQLPPLPSQQEQGFKLYADKAKIEDSTGKDGIKGSRIDSMAIVPTTAGTLILPELRVQWWDVDKDKMQIALLPSESFQVLPALIDSIAPSDLATNQSTGPVSPENEGAIQSPDTRLTTTLLISNAVFALLVLIFGVLWWRLSREKTDGNDKAGSEFPSDNKLFKPVRVAAASNDYTKLRGAIIQWARGRWRDPSIHTLTQVADRIGNVDLDEVFQQLDLYMYAKGGKEIVQPKLDGLIEQLEKIQQSTAREKPVKAKELLPFYPKPGSS